MVSRSRTWADSPVTFATRVLVAIPADVDASLLPVHAAGAHNARAESVLLRSLMAVPKKKTSKMKTRSRRASAWKLESSARSNCPRCRAAKLPHRVCGNCGWYNGRQAIDID